MINLLVKEDLNELRTHLATWGAKFEEAAITKNPLFFGGGEGK